MDKRRFAIIASPLGLLEVVKEVLWLATMKKAVNGEPFSSYPVNLTTRWLKHGRSMSTT